MRQDITVAEADLLLEQQAGSLPLERVPLGSAGGRILREAVAADRPVPPYDRITMDGIALLSADVAKGQRQFPVTGVVLAGRQQVRLARGTCLRVMTGGVLPAGADCVVPVEEIDVANDLATLLPDAQAVSGRSVHRAGSDSPAGQVILQPGVLIDERHLGGLASVGKASVIVGARPRIAVLTTGDEVVPVAGPVADHQVRQSNRAVINGWLQLAGMAPQTVTHLPDDSAVLGAAITNLVSQVDVLITCGAVSKGDTDVIPGLLEEAGFLPVFHRIRQRPGKPMWFGVHPEGPVAFGLPGNPVSVLVCLARYVQPWLQIAQGRAFDRPPLIALARTVSFRPALTWFLPVRVATTAGRWSALPVPVGNSGDYLGIVDTDGLVELAEGQDEFPEGFVAPLHLWSRS